MAKVTAEAMKVHLAYEMAKHRMATDPQGQELYFWVSHYYRMRDFDLLDLWMEKNGDQFLVETHKPSLN